MTPIPDSFDFTGNVQPVELEPIYWLDGQRLSRAFCQALPASLADLLDIVMAVYAQTGVRVATSNGHSVGATEHPCSSWREKPWSLGYQRDGPQAWRAAVLAVRRRVVP